MSAKLSRLKRSKSGMSKFHFEFRPNQRTFQNGHFFEIKSSRVKIRFRSVEIKTRCVVLRFAAIDSLKNRSSLMLMKMIVR